MQPRQLSQYRFRRPQKIEEPKKKSFDILKWTSVVAPFLILLGICRLYFYYRWFGVNIVSFLDFGEIITSIFDYIIPLLYYNVPVVLIGVTILTGSSKFFIRIWIIAGSFLQIVIYWLVLPRIDPFFQLILFIYSIFILFIIGYYQFLKRRHANDLTGIVTPIVAMLIIFMFLSSGTVGTQKAIYVIDKRTYKDVKISLKDSTTLPTDSANYYIGNTKNYIFIYHAKTKKTAVMKMERIESIDFPNQTIQN